jgi:hypothetical protein
MAGLVRTWKAILASTALTVAGVAHLAIAQQFDPWQNSRLMQSMSNYWAPNYQSALGQLANNEAIVIHLKGFNIAKAGVKGDTFSHADTLHAREVGEGAIIFRSGDKVFIVDGTGVTR